MKNNTIILGCIILLTTSYCSVLKSQLETPSYFPKPSYSFENNPISKKQIELGRNLFYDPILSADNSISCASCHSSYAGFAHTDHDLSHGIEDRIGARNAPPLFNLAWQYNFMWDGAIDNLDAQALAPISHKAEMGSDLNTVLSKLKEHPKYPALFKAVYQDGNITGERLLKLLSQFQLTLISANAKYDRVNQGNETFTAQELNGYSLFKANCASCHKEPLFSNFEFANNGLPVDTTLNDWGRYKVTNISKDSLQFKIPSLRNLTYTYPYMHDGRFKKLGQVINHYVNGIKENQAVAETIKGGIKLTKNEQIDLITFLLTLDDESFVTNEKFKINRAFFIED